MKEIPILYESDNYLVINKPSGISVHKGVNERGETIADWFVAKYPEATGVGTPLIIGDLEIDRSGIVHRLDKNTSGALILAKNQQSYVRLKKQFKRKEVQKTYHALVSGNIKEDRGIITKPIARDKSDFRKRTVSNNFRGVQREAETIFKVLKRGILDGKKVTFIEVYPKTGRTHQIRVHLASISKPVFNDLLYGGRVENFEVRMMLHAFKVSFLDDGKKIEAIANYPKDFSNTLDKILTS